MEADLVSCNNTSGFMQLLNIGYNPKEWRLFIDSSKTSLNCILLYNSNVLPSIPAGHAVHMKETSNNMKQLQRCINYDQSMTGNFVGIWRSLLSYYKSKVDILTTVIFFVNGTEVFTWRESGHYGNHWNLFSIHH